MTTERPSDNKIDALELSLVPLESSHSTGHAQPPSGGHTASHAAPPSGGHTASHAAPQGVCPHCNYRRRASDDGPAWQCPRCLTAYDFDKSVPRRAGSSPAEVLQKTPEQAPTRRAAERRAQQQGNAQGNTKSPAPASKGESSENRPGKLGVAMLATVLLIGGAGAWQWHQRQEKTRQAKAREALDSRAAAVSAVTGDMQLRQQIDALENQYRNGKAAEALPAVRAIAERGETRAMVLLAVMLADSRTVQNNGGNREDNNEAARIAALQATEWLQRAANAGDALAMVRLGNMYERGRSIQREPARAENWYFQAARQGYAPGLYSLGQLYARGAPPVDKRPLPAYTLLLIAQRLFKEDPHGDSLLPSENSALGASAAVRGMTSTLDKSEIAQATQRAEEWKPGMALGF